MRRRSFLLGGLAAAGAANLARSQQPDQDRPGKLKAGIIGCDTSHVIAFTRAFNAPEATGDLADIEVVAAYPGGSEDVAASRDRVEGFTQQLREMGLKIVDSIPALLEQVDVVLLESVDGRPHLAQVRPVFEAGKPVFIDKPLAGSLADAVEIFRLAEQHEVPCFSSSSLRFSPDVQKMRDNEEIGRVVGCDAYGPCSLEAHHPDLFWYGIHGVETLFTIMGTGCEGVNRVQTDGTELVVGTWSDGRIGTFRGIREGKSGYGATVFGSKAIAPAGGSGGYQPLLVEIARFFKTGRLPVSHEETLEIFAFMQAADVSKQRQGARVALTDVLADARSDR